MLRRPILTLIAVRSFVFGPLFFRFENFADLLNKSSEFLRVMFIGGEFTEAYNFFLLHELSPRWYYASYPECDKARIMPSFVLCTIATELWRWAEISLTLSSTFAIHEALYNCDMTTLLSCDMNGEGQRNNRIGLNAIKLL